MIQGLHCLPFHPHYLDTLLSGKTTLLKVKDNFHFFGMKAQEQHQQEMSLLKRLIL